MDISQLNNIPPQFYSDQRTRYKFYPTREAYQNSKGYSIKEMCTAGGSAAFSFANKSFLEEHNLTTVKDALDLLNSWGFSRAVYDHLADYGFYFDSNHWTWIFHGPTTLSLVVTKREASSSSSIFSKSDIARSYLHYDTHYNGGLFCIVWAEESALPPIDAPNWMHELQGYKFTPKEWKYMRDRDVSELTFGVEIEVLSSLSRFDLQYLVTNVEPRQEPFFYFKHDGSITSGTGSDYSGLEPYEIVTMPCSYRFLSQNLRILFKKIEDHVPGGKAVFKTPESCGVHIHVGRDSFFSDLHKRKFVAIWNQYDSLNSGFIQKLGKRKFNNYCKPAELHEGRTLARRLSIGNMAPGHSGGKYSSCRETGGTVEVRVFKGGFDFDHIMYCLEAVHAMHCYAHKSPISTISTRNFIPDFTGWVQDERRYRRLKENLTQCA